MSGAGRMDVGLHNFAAFGAFHKAVILLVHLPHVAQQAYISIVSAMTSALGQLHDAQQILL